MFCPQCGKEVAEAQQYCAFCGNSLQTASGAASARIAQPRRRVFPWRLLVLALLLCGVFAAWLYQQINPPNTDQFARQMATLPFKKKQWYEISRTLGVSQPIDLRGYFGWLHEPVDRPSGNYKLSLICQCAASEPESVLFVIMDEQNLERMQAGYPPLALASSPIGGATEMEVPFGRRYWFGFVELASKPNAPGSIPTNVPGALLYLLNQYQRQNRPPIRLTAEIYTSVKLYATATDARREALAIKQKLAQASDSLPPVPPSQSSNPPETITLNEARAVANARVIGTAVMTYCNAYKSAPHSLKDLASANLINADLASGETSGYSLSIEAYDCGVYGIVARPLAWGSTGSLSLYLDATGALHATRENRPAMRTDPVLGGNGE